MVITMMSPKEAYDIFLKRFPDARTDHIADWGEFYACSACASNDMVDDYWKIDKATGEITFWDYAEYAEYVRRMPDDFYPKSYDVKDLK